MLKALRLGLKASTFMYNEWNQPGMQAHDCKPKYSAVQTSAQQDSQGNSCLWEPPTKAKTRACKLEAQMATEDRHTKFYYVGHVPYAQFAKVAVSCVQALARRMRGLPKMASTKGCPAANPVLRVVHTLARKLEGSEPHSVPTPRNVELHPSN